MVPTPPQPETSDPNPATTATTRVLNTIELLEQILYKVDHQTITICPQVSKLWQNLLKTSQTLLQHHFLHPSPPSTFLLWRYNNNTPVRTPIKSFDLRPKVLFSKSIQDLDLAPLTWDRTNCILHPSLLVQPSISPRTVTDVKFSVPETFSKVCRDAFVSQPPCRMSQFYVQKFLDVRRSAHRLKRYLAPGDERLATLGKLKAVLEAREEVLGRGGRVGEALRKFDGEKALFVDGFIHEDAVLVQMAREKWPEAVDPAQMGS